MHNKKAGTSLTDSRMLRPVLPVVERHFLPGRRSLTLRRWAPPASPGAAPSVMLPVCGAPIVAPACELAPTPNAVVLNAGRLVLPPAVVPPPAPKAKAPGCCAGCCAGAPTGRDAGAW